jgi:hypothetical protein
LRRATQLVGRQVGAKAMPPAACVVPSQRDVEADRHQAAGHVGSDRMVRLPSEVPAGPAELIVLVDDRAHDSRRGRELFGLFAHEPEVVDEAMAYVRARRDAGKGGIAVASKRAALASRCRPFRPISSPPLPAHSNGMGRFCQSSAPGQNLRPQDLGSLGYCATPTGIVASGPAPARDRCRSHCRWGRSSPFGRAQRPQRELKAKTKKPFCATICLQS